MVICELCASANNELDETCRVCGQALKSEVGTRTPAPSGAASQHVSNSWSASPPMSSASNPVDHVPASALQMSAVKQAPQTGVPPMMSSQREEAESAPDESRSTAMPGFMQSARVSAPQPEPVQLVSASDLPEWIRQIAAADEAKAAAEAAAVQPVEPAATIARRPLPGETHAGGPSANWLSKSGAQAESSEQWGSAEVASTHWASQGSADMTAPTPAGPETPVFARSTTDAYSTPQPKRRFSLASPATSSSSGTPLYRRQSVQLAAIVALVALIVFMML